MKTLNITTFSMLSIASLALLLSACGSAVNTTANISTANSANKSNTAVVTNSNQTAANNTAPVSNTAPTPGQSETSQIRGELQVGKTESVILYVGMESGDYAGYCFTNDSEAGAFTLSRTATRYFLFTQPAHILTSSEYEGKE